MCPIFQQHPAKCPASRRIVYLFETTPAMEFNIRLVSRFSTSCVLRKKVPSSLKGHSQSSHNWLTRQINDPYVELAKMENFRCRSAFKLIQIDDRFHIIAPGMQVVDCGAAPGGWTQVLVKRTNADRRDPNKPRGFVIGIDQNPFHPIDGAVTLGNMDITKPDTQKSLLDMLNGSMLDLIVSDMAPNATGMREMDHDNIIHLAYLALRFALQTSKKGASCLVKIWDGRNTGTLQQDMLRFYERVRTVKPDASRANSAELFLLARGFQGLKS